MLLEADEAVVTVSENVMAPVGTLYTLAKDLGMTSFSTSDQTLKHCLFQVHYHGFGARTVKVISITRPVRPTVSTYPLNKNHNPGTKSPEQREEGREQTQMASYLQYIFQGRGAH